MQMFAQLIIDKDIFLQTVSVDAEFSQKSWKLQPECKIPEHSNTFLLAILRHSKTQGTRLLGYTEVTRDEAIVSGEDKTPLCLDVVKVNHDGPLLKLSANISVVESPVTKSSNGIHPFENEANSVRSDFRTTEAYLKQMGENSDRKPPPDALELWVMHERILFLPSSTQRAKLLAHLGEICSTQWKVSHVADQLSQAICAYEDAVRDDPENPYKVNGDGPSLKLIANVSTRNFKEASYLCDKPGRLNNLGQLEKAVEWLEQGRSIIWGQLLNLRTPVDNLRKKHPELAVELISLSAQLEAAATERNDISDSRDLRAVQSTVQQAHNNAHKRDELLKKIRGMDWFQRFLLPMTFVELSTASEKGAVVLLNVSEISCDALVTWSSASATK
ncbi:hypothetical protein B0H19DRAFT_1074643 [Mycena capillaripes]|nr:hypothetical protein B0H19DRAFT_1074643 [Mycena capillaripes]